MSSEQVYDVIVIGGGPAGMMAAGTAAKRGKRVVLVEKNKDLGKKLSITGGGRCNILNAEKDTRKLLDNYGDSAKFLYSPFAQFGMQDTWDFFEEGGLPLTIEARKRTFPESQKAEDVTYFMRRFCTDNNVELRLKTRVDGLIVEDGQLVGLKTNHGDMRAKKFILSTGGSSHSETGSTGEGVNWLKQFGHTVHTPNPNIVPLTVEDQWVKDLSGTTLSFMKITFGSNLSKEQGRFAKTGKVLFTHFGLSGPLILNSAYEVKKLLNGGSVEAEIDLYPDTEVGTIREKILKVFEQNKNKTLKNVLKEFVPHGMSEAVAAQLEGELLEEKVHSVSREARHAIADRLKAMPLTITGTMGMDWAVISDGGVDLREVDTKTMQSKKVENLYLVGDVLNVNRPSGGFSLQLCWTTGYVAGQNV